MARWFVMVASVAALGAGVAAAAGARGSSTKAFDRSLQNLGGQLRQEAWTQALATLRDLRDQVASRAPLEIVDIQALAGPPQGLGMYTPLVDGAVHGDELFVYAEVHNHGIAEVAGYHEIHLSSDLVILDDAGQELARDEGFGESHFTSRVPHRPTFVSIALRTRGLPPGGYRLRLILHDRVGRKKTQAEVPFRISQ